MPPDILVDYNEARDIFDRSPRGASALLRLCVQKICKYLGKSGKNLNDDIKSLVTEGLSDEVQRALDLVRVVGNNAVHPGEMDVRDSPELGLLLFDMVNRIVEDRISLPLRIKRAYEFLPSDALNAVAKRDSSVKREDHA